MAVALLLMSCSMKNANEATNESTTETTNMQTSQTKVRLTTTYGDIVVALYNETPQHRDNFVKLVKEGYYNGVLWHRVIKDFMVQTGDGNSKTAGPNDVLGAGDPGYTVPAEFVYPKYFHRRGALAAARTPDQVNPERASSGSQFYIVTGKIYSSEQLKQMEAQLANAAKQGIFQQLVGKNQDKIKQLQQAGDNQGLQTLQNELINQVEQEYATHPFKFTDEQLNAYTSVGGTPFLDNQYTVFGEVVEGMDVVDKIENVKTGANDRPVDDVKIISATLI